MRVTVISRQERMASAIEFAKALLEDGIKEQSFFEKRRLKALSKLIADPESISFVTHFTDQCFRSHDDARVASQLHYLIEKHKLPRFLPPEARIGLLFFQNLGRQFPTFFIPKLKKKIYQEMSHFFRQKKEEGVKINVNHLGEAILGEEEARERLKLYLKDFDDPEIFAISVKISTLYSQINLVGWNETLTLLKKRLRTLYRASRGKTVMLDMEEYKDLDLTLALFKEVLSEPEFSETRAGIVLQGYLPDAFAKQKELTEWARGRSTPIHVRLVKGANLAMEKVESGLKTWPQAPFETKLETDANYIRMIEYGLQKENAKAVHIGIGSHNLFDIAYAHLLSQENEVAISFEMLQGMAEPLRRALQKRVGEILLYSPEVRVEDFQYAAPYLIRRLDENSAKENFLRHVFHLEPDSPEWEALANDFQKAFQLVDKLPESPRRSQNRLITSLQKYENEPDTDFSLEENRKWASQIYEEWKDKKLPSIPKVSDVEKIFSGAKKWDEGVQERAKVLSRVADLLRQRRGELIGAMMVESSKTFEEGDVEVSEAIDFVEYYRKCGEEIFLADSLSWEAKGTILVAPPWNFPVSIPVGGVSAALMGGNAVLLKPAPETVFIGSIVAQTFWDAGVPKHALQFIPCEDEPTGSQIVEDKRLKVAVLTGATETAKKFLSMHPGLDLMAETGGKNTMIMTAMADRDLAISDLLKSAFGHAGQKCSACSLAILEKELYDDPDFLNALKDAAESLRVGSALNPATKVPPLIRSPDVKIFQLDAEEKWLLEPHQDPENPLLYSPGIKMGVIEGSRTHQTEFFAPILGLMRAESLSHAIRLANGTPYGLTAGLHSLDEREHEVWKNEIVAGNLYINRTTTGAIVLRQPFGGTKASGFGPGAKAGGPNYIAQFANLSQTSLPKASSPLPSSLIPMIEKLPQLGLKSDEIFIWKRSVENYAYWAEKWKTPDDPVKVLGQDNFFYMKPHDKITLRLYESDSRLDILRVIAACICCGTRLEISAEEFPFHLPNIDWTHESERDFLYRVEKGECHRLRLLQPPSEELKKRASIGFTYIDSQPPLASGRFEVLHYMREVSLSHTTHRYGYIAK